MPILIQYLIKLSISLSLVWLFYQLVLRRLTFYNWNRWFLLGYSLLAFFIPLIDISPVLEQTVLINHEVVQFIPMVEGYTSGEKSFSFNTWDWALVLLATGCSVLLVRLIILHISFLRLRRSASLILEAPVKVYQIDDNIIPFSFGNEIFINRHQHSDVDLQEIVRHEFVHVRQKHSIDMLCAEWLCILNWYNPFAWLLRSAMRQNLEFIADNQVVQNGLDVKQYQYLLLKVIGVPQYSIATNFNFSSLKKRIAMMNKMKSAKVHLVKFLFLVPLVGVMLLAFRNKVTNQNNPDTALTEIDIIDTVPVAPVKPARPAFPKDVASIVANGNELTVTLKNGSKETYNLDKPEQRAAFEKKYGQMPEPPAPPEPQAPPEPPKPAEPSAPARPSDLEASKSRPPAIAPPAPPTPVVPRIPANVSGIHIHNEKATIKLKNGTVETYDLNKPNEKESFEKKYGDFTPTPPVKPVPPSAPKVAPVTSTLSVTGLEPVVAIDLPVPVTSVSTTLSADVIYVQPTNHSQSPDDKEETIMEITKETTKEQIDELKTQLLSKGYTFSISSLKYYNRTLHSIDAIISDEESKSRLIANDFRKIIISRVTYKDGKSGFYIRIIDGVIKF